MVGRQLSFWDGLFSGAILVSGGVMVEMLSSFSWQLHSQKMQAISIRTPKICRGSLLICLWVWKVSIPVPLTDLKSNHLSFLSFFIVSHDFDHFKCHDYLSTLTFWLVKTNNNQPITSDFPSFPRVNPSSEDSTHGAALGGWTRAGSAPSVSASRASQEAGLFEG